MNGIIDAALELEQFQLKVEKFFFENYNEQDFIKQTEAILELNPSGVVFSPTFSKEVTKDEFIPVDIINQESIKLYEA